MPSLWRALTRRKSPDLCLHPDDQSKSPLARVLTTLDLTALGIGSTLGVGVYVLAGSVARDMAGPAVIISFAIAALASLFAGLCYAEFGARVPLAGSAYIYSYVSIGEFLAFVIGWNLIMEYVIGCASVARGLSNYLDQLMDNAMQKSFESFWHLHVDFLSPYFDFFAFGVSFILSVILALGVKESMVMNNLFTLVNMSVVLFVIVAGSFKADISNWELSKDDIPAGYRAGEGGFFPFGVMGVLKGAATCFYGFIGFDCIATTGEEVRNPQKAIPLAIIVSLFIIFLSYFGISAVLTLMWPYYLQDEDAPLPYVFEQIGWPVAQWIVAIGGIFGLFASLFGAMYPLPRVIYAMANDGLLFRFLGEVHPRYKTPLVGTLLAGLLTGLMAALFKLQQLVNMLSIGTLMAYTIVATCVLILRYKHELSEGLDVKKFEEEVCLLKDDHEKSKDVYQIHESDSDGALEYKETTNLVTLMDRPTATRLFYQLFNWHGLEKPTPTTCCLVNVETVVYCCLSMALGLCLVHMENGLQYGRWGPLMIVCVLGALLLLVLLSISLQPTSKRPLAFKVPLVPVVPAISITLNLYLMLMLDLHTWIRFAIWMAIGVGVYFITVPCRKLKLCCIEHDFSISTTELDHQDVLVSVVPSTTITDDIPEGPQMKVTANGVGCEVKAAGNTTSILRECSETEKQSNNLSSSPSIDDGVEVQLPYKVDLGNPPHASEGFCRREDLEEMTDSISEVSDFETLEATKSQTYSSDCEASDIYEEIVDVVNTVVQAKNVNIFLSHTFENIDLKEPLKPAETIDPNTDCRSEFIEDNATCTEHAATCISDASSEIFLKAKTSSCTSTVDLQTASIEYDDVSECDIQSLYPNVVVISSSEEDVCSDTGLSGCINDATQISEESDGLALVSPNPEENIPSFSSHNKNDVDLSEMVSGYHLKNNSNTTTTTSNIEVLDKHPSVDVCMSETTNSASNERELDNPDLELPLSVCKHLSSDESDPSEETIIKDVTTPLRNVSFVEKLEKIIQDQATVIGQKSIRFRKTNSLSDVSHAEHPSPEEDAISSTFSGKREDNTRTAEQNGTVSPSLTQVLKEVDTRNDAVLGSGAHDDNADGEREDIRTKLEKIFSTGRNSQFSHLIMSHSPPIKPKTPEHHDENVQATADSQNANEIFPTVEIRKKMADVLGTITQRSKKDKVNIKDFFDVEDSS